MAAGTTFYRRLAGGTLTKATGLSHENGNVPSDYAYIELGGIDITDEEAKGIVVIVPDVNLDVKQRIMVEVNPILFGYGPTNYPMIIEIGETPAVLVNTLKEIDVESLPYVFRIYVLR